MPRCQSWRPVPDVDNSHIGHLPPGCRKCWRPCRARVPAGQVRCHECLLGLRDHVSSFVRAALAAEPDTPTETLEFLAGDSDLTVSAIAGRALARRGQRTETEEESDPWAG